MPQAEGSKGPSPAPAAEATGLHQLHREIASCTTCPSMKPWRQFAQDAYGNAATGYLLVGEAPGYVSWKNRRRFTGPAGLLIRRALSQLDHPLYRDLEDLFYMTDVVKCHPAPPGNRQSNRSPTRAEIAACTCYLERELDLLRPSVVVTFGKAASEAVARVLSGLAEHARGPEVLAFPHPSPRNQRTILKSYPSMEALQSAIARSFGRLIGLLDEGTMARHASRVTRQGSR